MEMREQLDQMRRRTEELERELLDQIRRRRSGAEIVPLRSVRSFLWEQEDTS